MPLKHHDHYSNKEIWHLKSLEWVLLAAHTGNIPDCHKQVLPVSAWAALHLYEHITHNETHTRQKQTQKPQPWKQWNKMPVSSLLSPSLCFSLPLSVSLSLLTHTSSSQSLTFLFCIFSYIQMRLMWYNKNLKSLFWQCTNLFANKVMEFWNPSHQVNILISHPDFFPTVITSPHKCFLLIVDKCREVGSTTCGMLSHRERRRRDLVQIARQVYNVILSQGCETAQCVQCYTVTWVWNGTVCTMLYCHMGVKWHSVPTLCCFTPMCQDNIVHLPGSG